MADRDLETVDAEYDAWFRAKIAASLADPRPSIPHDEAMAIISAVIDSLERRG